MSACIWAFVFLFITFSVEANELATTDGGKRVQLNNDGTWVNLSNQDVDKLSKTKSSISQSSSGVSKSKSSYTILNTFTTDQKLFLCVEAKNNTTDKITKPSFGDISCTDDSSTCITYFTGSVLDGSYNNLDASVAPKTLLHNFIGVDPGQISLYPADSAIFKIVALRPVDFSRMKLNIDGVTILFDAKNKIQSFPAIDSQKKREDPFYWDKWDKKVNALICDGPKKVY